MWFKELTGFNEESPENVRNNIKIQDNKLISKVNNREFVYGKLSIPTLEELRAETPPLNTYNSQIKISEIVGNVQEFHKEPENNGAFFQAASQFNLLEMVGPTVTPEKGIAIYEYDNTQGPACAIACGAGTIYRNYFVNVNNQNGQTKSNQVDCLEELGKTLENEKYDLWQMSNGYALANKNGLKIISEKIKNLTEQEYEQLKGKLKIGIQSDTEVTIDNCGNLVTQAYCSALPVSYADVETKYWEDFARLILTATYEATFYAAFNNYLKTNNNKVFLTLVGGGAFGNRNEWIFDAIRNSVQKFSNLPLDVKIVSYGSSNYNVREFIKTIIL